MDGNPHDRECEQRIKELEEKVHALQLANSSFDKSEDRYRSMVELTTDWIWELDKTGAYIYSSAKVKDLLGYEPAEVIGKTPFDFMPPEEAKRFTAGFERIANSPRPITNIENTQIRKEGRRVVMETTSIPHINKDGRLLGWRGTNRDITERKQAEEILRASEEKFRSIVETTSDWVWEVDQNGGYTYVDPKVKDFFGYEPEELLGRPFYSLMPKEDAKLEASKFKSLVESPRPIRGFENTQIHKDGRRVFVETNGVTLFDKNGKFIGWRGTTKDITERKRAEETLRASEERYRQLFEDIIFPVTLCDSNGKTLMMNPAGAKGLGGRPEDFIGKNIIEYLPSHADFTIERVRNVIQADKMTSFGDTMFDLPTGKRWFWSVYAPVHDSNGKAFAVQIISHDITSRKEAENNLSKLRNLLSNIVNSMPSVLVGVDAEGRVIQWNQEAERLTGVSAESAEGRLITEVFLDLANDMEAVQRAIKERQPLKDERVKLEPDGETRFSDLTIYPLIANGVEGAVIRIDDITERKQAEEAIRASNNKFSAAFHSSPNAIIISQLSDGRIADVNDSFIQISGYSRDEVIGHTAISLGLWKESSVRDKIILNLQRDGKLVNFEAPFGRKSGEQGTGLLSASIIEMEGERCLLGTMNDITAIRKTEEEKSKLEEQLRQAQKIEALGTLAGGIAHDFNNLLMGIQGRASLMLMDIDETNTNFEHLRGIEQYVRSASDLTKQLLGFARGGKYVVRPVDMNQTVEKSASMFSRTKKEIIVHAKYQEDLWTVEADQGQIEQVLLNIFINAWQAMPGGGRLYLRTENVELNENYIKAFKVKTGTYVKVSITDTGTGMDDATLKRIFDPFFTTKKMGRGTGLGLSTAYGIIKNHDGIINAYSEKGKGTTFNIYLPSSEKKASKEKELSSGILKGEGTVLLVDDEAIIIDVASEMIKSLGYQVLIARNGKEAVEIYQKEKDRVNLVILDMIMPEMSGGETFDKLREISPDVRVLLSSGYSIDGHATEILDRGCNGFIQKPFNLKDLSKNIKSVLDMQDC